MSGSLVAESYSVECDRLRAFFSALTGASFAASATTPPASPLKAAAAAASAPPATLMGSAVLELADAVGLVALGRPLPLALDPSDEVSYELFLALVDEMRATLRSSLHQNQQQQQHRRTSSSLVVQQVSPISAAAASDGTRAETLRLQLAESEQAAEQLRASAAEMSHKLRAQEAAAKAAAAEIEQLRANGAAIEDDLRQAREHEAELQKRLSDAVARFSTEQKRQRQQKKAQEEEEEKPPCTNCAELEQEVRMLRERLHDLAERDSLSRAIASSASEIARTVVRDQLSPQNQQQQQQQRSVAPQQQPQQHEECPRCAKLEEQLFLLLTLESHLREQLRIESRRTTELYSLLARFGSAKLVSLPLPSSRQQQQQH